MFEDATFESMGTIHTRSRNWMIATFGFNASILAALIAIPLFYPSALPQMLYIDSLDAPRQSKRPSRWFDRRRRRHNFGDVGRVVKRPADSDEPWVPNTPGGHRATDVMNLGGPATFPVSDDPFSAWCRSAGCASCGAARSRTSPRV